MKLKLTFILSLLLTIAYAQSNHLTVEYGVKKTATFKSDTIKNSFLQSVMKKLFSDTNTTDHLSFILKSHNKQSLFTMSKSIDDNKKTFSINPIEIELETRGEIFTSLNKNTNYSIKTNDKIIVTDTINFKWKLLKDVKTIAGYECYKAVGERKLFKRKSKTYVTKKVIAWYTPKINTSFGPSGYAGLPGLILELQEPDLLTFYAKKINFKNTTKIKKLPKYKTITRLEYDTILSAR